MVRWNGAASAVVGATEADATVAGSAGETRGGEPGDAWSAGHEMGRLDAQLAARSVRIRVGLTIMEVNRDAAAAIARRHGYDLHVRAAAERGFVWAEFWPRPV